MRACKKIKKKTLGIHYLKRVEEIKTSPQVYTVQEGIEEIKNNLQVYAAQEDIKKIKNYS